MKAARQQMSMRSYCRNLTRSPIPCQRLTILVRARGPCFAGLPHHFSLLFVLDVEEESVEDVLETGGSTPSSAAVAASASRQARLLDALAGVAEISSEKRTAKRESLLKRLFKALTQFAAGPTGQGIVEQHLDEVVSAASGTGLRAGAASPSEQYAACRVLEATAVVLGGDHDDYCQEIDKPLKRVVMMAGRATAVRAAALRALSMCNFMCSGDDVTTESLLDLCEAVAAPEYRNETVPPFLRATALDCWALLATTIEDVYIADQSDFHIGRGIGILSLLKDCLETTNVELRSAAGECMAMIHEARLNLGLHDQAENVTARRYRRGSWDGSEWEVLMDEVKQLISELSVESGHHMSKRAKKEQRATFREFMSTIVDDEAPCEVVSFRGGSLELKTWKEIIQLNFIRHCLQGGFQIQLVTNETLHTIFGANAFILNDASGAALSQLEKRLIMSKTSEASKQADQKLNKKRETRTNVKNYFLTVDGEDL